MREPEPYSHSLANLRRAEVGRKHGGSPRPMIHETSLGLTLMILVTIAGMEIMHLVHVSMALAVMGTSLAASLLSYVSAR